MLECRDKIWLENFKELFCNFNIIPFNGMSLEQQLNAVTRMVILIFLILFLLFDFRYALLFFVLSLLFIIILYYIQRKNMKENYETQLKHHSNYDDSTFDYNNFGSNNPLSNNQILTISRGFGANPKTKINPILEPRSHDFDVWKATNNTQHSHINSKSQFDNYRSGYIPSEDTCKTDEYTVTPKNTIEEYTVAPRHTIEEYTVTPSINTSQKPKECYDPYSQCGGPYPYIKSGSLCGVEGHINTACGCNMQNNGMQVNQPSGMCQQDSSLTKYNKNLNTMSLQPNVHVINEVNEPINSLMGISFQQQSNPRTVEHLDNGKTIFTEHATDIIEEVTEPFESTDVAYVYDPRSSGHGDSNRCYIDPMLGQPRYFYDDIDAMKNPNYVVRSKIDHMNKADHYGPLENYNRNGNIHTPDIRKIAQDQYLNDQLSHRNDLMQKLMKKGNNKRNQQRRMPIRPF